MIKWQALDHWQSDYSSPDLVPPDHVVRLLSTRLSERCQTSCWWSPTFTRWTFHQIVFNPQKCSKFTKKSPIVKIVNQKFCSAAISSWEGGDADTLRAKQGLNMTNLVKAQKLPSKYKSTFLYRLCWKFFMQLEATLPSGVKKSFSDGNIRLFSRFPQPPTQYFVLQIDWLPSNNFRTSHFHFRNLTFTFLCRSGSHDTEPGLETIQVILVYRFFSSSSFQNLSVAFQRF